jgi:methylated-DNA-[protein]-cysteine S-methyltransferase
MSESGFTLFETAIGTCGIAWGPHGIRTVRLPEASPRATRARILTRCPDAREAAPPPAVQRTIDGIVALLRGEAADLRDVELDLEGIAPFDRAVYAVARTIPPGATLTYGEVAAQLAEAGTARDVGQSLGNNPFPIVVPCHRVLAAGGKLRGFSAPGGVATKLRLLTIEGARTSAAPSLFDGVPTV